MRRTVSSLIILATLVSLLALSRLVPVASKEIYCKHSDERYSILKGQRSKYDLAGEDYEPRIDAGACRPRNASLYIW